MKCATLTALALLGFLRASPASAKDPHDELFAKQRYPSALECKKCHERIYREWSLSAHAYASISPTFHKFEQKISDLTQGTIGTFCVRCHSPAGTALGEPRELPLWDRVRVSREGVTCVACHRVNEGYGRVNAERRIVPGDIHQPVYGNTEGSGAAEVAAQPDLYKVRISSTEARGVPMHAKTVRFEPLATSQFCLSCHQVAVHPGIKLEVVWDQYRASPAAKAFPIGPQGRSPSGLDPAPAAKGTRCQDCHMGKTPGRPEGFDSLPAAVIAGQARPPRPHHDHGFFGPGYSISHPGLFPYSESEVPIKDWLLFDYRAGWGTPEFEAEVEKGGLKADFPSAWSDRTDREDARKVVDENLEKLAQKRESRRRVMENGTRLEGPFFASAPRAGRALSFHYEVTNLNPGHNAPSGSLGAQPEIWLDVALIDPDGGHVWESGYVDSNGDMADLHSLDVAAGKIPRDGELFNLQTKFLTTNIKGTDREMYLPVNFDIDQIPFIRPAPQPVSVINHPPFVRMEGRSLPPLGTRKARYRVPSGLMKKPGTYRLAARLRNRAEPIYFMKFIGATSEMIRAMNAEMLDIHPATVSFEVR